MEVEQLNHEYIEGSGAPLVFIHGWLGSKEDWQKVRHYLDLDNPMLFYDQRCHGDSGCKEFDFNDLADDLDRLIEKYSLENPVLVGHSMGGMVALTYFVRHTVGQNQVSGLVLIGTSASTPEPENGSPKYFLDNFGRIDRREWAREITENYVGDNKELGKIAYQELLNANDTAVISGLESMINYNLVEELSHETTDAVIISGSEDGAITTKKIDELVNCLNAELVEIESTHLITGQRPKAVANAIHNFMKD